MKSRPKEKANQNVFFPLELQQFNLLHYYLFIGGELSETLE